MLNIRCRQLFVIIATIWFTYGFAYSTIITPDSVISSGMPINSSYAKGLIDGDTTRAILVRPFSIGAFFEFGFDQSYQSSLIRLYNDYGVNDDSLITFNLDFYLNDQLVSQEKDLTSPLAVSMHDILFSNVTNPFNRVRLYPLTTQYPNSFQMREIQFDATPATSSVPEPGTFLLLGVGCLGLSRFFRR